MEFAESPRKIAAASIHHPRDFPCHLGDCNSHQKIEEPLLDGQDLQDRTRWIGFAGQNSQDRTRWTGFVLWANELDSA